MGVYFLVPIHPFGVISKMITSGRFEYGERRTDHIFIDLNECKLKLTAKGCDLL
mgnify:CR=1 FL=1